MSSSFRMDCKKSVPNQDGGKLIERELLQHELLDNTTASWTTPPPPPPPGHGVDSDGAHFIPPWNGFVGNASFASNYYYSSADEAIYAIGSTSDRIAAQSFLSLRGGGPSDFEDDQVSFRFVSIRLAFVSSSAGSAICPSSPAGLHTIRRSWIYTIRLHQIRFLQPKHLCCSICQYPQDLHTFSTATISRFACFCMGLQKFSGA